MPDQDYSLKEITRLVEVDEVIKVVQDMVRIPSTNPPGYESDMAKYIINYMETNGIPTDIQEFAPGRFNVVARLKGRGISKALMFTGHMDVAPVSELEAGQWEVGPFSGEIKDGMIFGRGSSDMKGGLGAAMVALVTLARNRIKPSGDIVLAATGDEEDVMRGSKELIKSPLIADVEKVVVCEPTDMGIHTCSRGRTWADIVVFGKTAHASLRGVGVNAIDRAVMLMNCMQSHHIPHNEHPLLGDSFWQVTLIHGGIEPAVVPDSCTFTVDARLVPGQMPDDIWREMENLIESLKKEYPDFRAEVNIIEKREPWETSRDDKIIQLLKDACENLGIPVTYSGFSGTTDGTIFRRAGISGVIFGPGLTSHAHKENEQVPIQQLLQAAQVYAATMVLW